MLAATLSNSSSETREVAEVAGDDGGSVLGSLDDLDEGVLDVSLTGALFTSTIPESGCIGAAATRVAEAEEAAVRSPMAIIEKRIMDVMEGLEELR